MSLKIPWHELPSTRWGGGRSLSPCSAKNEPYSQAFYNTLRNKTLAGRQNCGWICCKNFCNHRISYFIGICYIHRDFCNDVCSKTEQCFLPSRQKKKKLSSQLMQKPSHVFFCLYSQPVTPPELSSCCGE